MSWVYVDSERGSDTATGESWSKSARTLGRAMEIAVAARASGVKIRHGSVFGPGDGIYRLRSGTPGRPFRVMAVSRIPFRKGSATILIEGSHRAIDIGAIGLMDVHIEGLTVEHTGGDPSSDAIRIICGANEGIVGASGITLARVHVRGKHKTRLGMNIQGVDGLRVVNGSIHDIWNGHRSQGAFIGGCPEVLVRRVEFLRCGWDPSNPETADAQNQSLYIRALPGIGLDDIEVAGCWFGDSSSWGVGISTDSATTPVRLSVVRSCVFSGGGKGVVLGAAEPGSHGTVSVRDCVFDAVGHGHDGSPGIGILAEGAFGFATRNYVGEVRSGFRPLLYDGELGKPPSQGYFAAPYKVGPLGTKGKGIESLRSVLRRARKAVS